MRVASRIQKTIAASALGLIGAGCVAIGAMAVSHGSQAELAAREARVARTAQQVAREKRDIAMLTADLARRQAFIEQMVDAHIGDEGASDQAGAAPLISAAAPDAAGLQRIKAEQLALVARLTRYADAHARTAADTIRRLGLNPAAMTRRQGGEGGPLVSLQTGADGSIDPHFAAMGKSLARMSALENGLAAIPQVSPAHVAYVSSSYGYRADPFTGGAAFHPGLDFPGPKGSPIYAAAKGTVTFVGQRNGYGNCVEITHGNGLMTRYGHLSGFHAHVGEKVEGGALIAAMGSTGRSTGSHLHFEVRVNDRPVNPRPFLEAARNIDKDTR